MYGHMVFAQVDEAEPPPKKAELLKSTSGDDKKNAIPRRRTDVSQNGRRKDDLEKDNASKISDRKIVDKKEKVLERKDKGLDNDKKIIDKFDSSAKSACVSAFKESDSWD